MTGGSSTSGVVANVLDCDSVMSEFGLHSHSYLYFQTYTLGKGMNPLISPAIGWILLLILLLFDKDGFGIKSTIKVYMPLIKETKLYNYIQAND